MRRTMAPTSLPRFATSVLGRKSSASRRGVKNLPLNNPSCRIPRNDASIDNCRPLAPNVCDGFNNAQWRRDARHKGHRALFPFNFQWTTDSRSGDIIHLDVSVRLYSTSGTPVQRKVTNHRGSGDSSTQACDIPTNEHGDPAATSDLPCIHNSVSHSQQQQQQQQQQQSSILSHLPPSLLPFAHLSRLDKPIGTYLLLHPCLWSTALAASPGSPPDLHLCALFAAGSFLLRGAGCTVNDMWDARYDAEVERTKTRPLPSGAVTRAQAAGWLGVQLCAGLGVLVSLPHVEECFVWGVASLPLVVAYPLMKRWMNYPQLVLGMTFNWGAIMGWVAVRGEVDWSVVGPLYLSGVGWTLVYDTLYAHQDRVDDAKLGLKSTALTFGERTKPILSVITAATWSLWMLTGYTCGYGLPWEAPYYYVGCTLAAAHLMWQIQSADLNNAENLAYRFRSNNLVGWMMFGSCALGNMMAG